ADVRLDPLTAHRRLLLSSDGRRVRWAFGTQDPPACPERFDASPCVLGRPGFTSGRHTWQVDLADGDFCAAGVSRESLRRHEPLNFSPRHGVWALQRWGRGGRALTCPPTPLPTAPRRIRVSLDYERGRVAFFDGEKHLFTFPPE
ncbi:PREDICTED: RING finger protein 39-like, partial [Acanthisitta chloris]|uniref:RING finger protein 39-like n=1 Tax=Acanthisitta chloris TaxID=57068 RepID=UPI0004F0CB16